MINAKEDYNAKGDGITDDTINLQNAIWAASKNAQKLYIPEGIYIVSGLKIPSNTYIVGNEGYSVLQRKFDLGEELGLIKIEEANNIVIQNLIIDGNKVTGRKNIFGCIYIDKSFDIYLRELKVFKGDQNGIVVRNGKNEENQKWTII